MFNMLVTEAECLRIIAARGYAVGESLEGRAIMNPYAPFSEESDIWDEAYRLGCKARPYPIVNQESKHV